MNIIGYRKMIVILTLTAVFSALLIFDYITGIIYQNIETALIYTFVGGNILENAAKRIKK